MFPKVNLRHPKLHRTMVDIDDYRKKAREAKETGDYSFIRTVPHDPRFPNINQTSVYFYRNCLQNFIDFHRCKRIYGEDYKPCNYFEFAYRDLCPSFMIEAWTEQVESDTFPYKIE
ncbi:unnamed protein product [Hydatigera taeniaeformis]|uniref:Cytochrome oxidase c subunit VIb n=1 Tax=Hydatigena taeniaeformis TaxID=6205 RepID=A0A0R3WNW0_HYDTA|nr:unnamed protein product [Hydatigera taeniaeformis]